MAAIQIKQKKRYDRRRRQASFTEGDLVLVYRPIRKKGRATKFLHRYFGPYRIVRRECDLNYVVEPLYGRRKKLDRVHVSSLKPFRRRVPSVSACVKSPVTAPPSAVKREARQKTPKVVRRRSQAAPPAIKCKTQLCEKDASPSSSESSGDRRGEYELRSRKDLRSPDRLDL